jgi:diphthamide synthase (EF-2-diphthine--ammonia ligase)
MNAAHDRVAMHAVRRELLVAQAAAVGVPLLTVSIPHPCPNAVYEARLCTVLAQAALTGVAGIAFGDLFLADIRSYRERLVAAVGLQAHFPLWGFDTRALAQVMVASGLRARLTCVDPKHCPREFAGQDFESVLQRLPAGIDPYGENGEFHTFAYAGPMFAQPMSVETGVVVERDGFVFADLFQTVAPGAPT